MRRLPIAVAILLLVELFLAEPALADNCGDFTDCFPTVKAAVATGAGAIGGAIAGWFAMGGGDLAGDDQERAHTPPPPPPRPKDEVVRQEAEWRRVNEWREIYLERLYDYRQEVNRANQEGREVPIPPKRLNRARYIWEQMKREYESRWGEPWSGAGPGQPP